NAESAISFAAWRRCAPVRSASGGETTMWQPRITKISEPIILNIASFIRAGGFPEGAAQAAGVPVDLFRRWLRRAETPRTRRLFRTLKHECETAAAQSRLAAEIRVHEKKPEFWLLDGPGKDVPGKAGWSVAARSIEPEFDRQSAMDEGRQAVMMEIMEQ